MTSGLFQDFHKRSREVSKYFIFLKSLESEDTQHGNKRIKMIDDELLRTLRASGFLLLYNLVEATMRNGIDAIFDELQGEGVSYDQIRPELKKIVLKNLKKRNPYKLVSSIESISLDIITVGFDKQDLFSGNVDGKLIRNIAKNYGFSPNTDYGKTGNGKDLRRIKENRNDLAHGFKSFAEVGKAKGADELIEIKNKVVQYLREILENIEQYLAEQEYLASTSNTSPP